MSDPSVCAVMLTCDRPELARCGIECFRAQTYPEKRLYIYDSGGVPCLSAPPDPATGILYHRAVPTCFTTLPPSYSPRSIGAMRNEANRMACLGERVYIPDVLMHWDDDDYSYPHRIAEQIVLLRASKAAAVGYREMLFWRDCGTAWGVGEAWAYSSGDMRYCLGTSLCYWRETWERHPFEDTARGEDWRWLSGIDSRGVRVIGAEGVPSMIARIHPGNVHNYDIDAMRHSERQGGEWRRVSEWDAHCAKVLA